MNDDPFQLYDLRVTVVEIRGRSVCVLRVGDWFEVRESSRLILPPGGHFCIYALASILPLLPAKQRRLSENDWLESDSLVACPDPEEQLIMRIERLGPVEVRRVISPDGVVLSPHAIEARDSFLRKNTCWSRV